MHGCRRRLGETAEQNEHLSERMSLAEKLNVTGVSLTALNSKGKVEKKVKRQGNCGWYLQSHRIIPRR